MDMEEFEMEQLPEGKGVILFIDDEAEIVEAEASFLTSLGYNVDGLTSSNEALKKIQENPDKYDLVITDLTMPGMTGLVLAERLLEINPLLPIILSSGFNDGETMEKAKNIGIKELIVKPWNFKELAFTVYKIIMKDDSIPMVV